MKTFSVALIVATAVGHGFREGKLEDLDGRLDILKPYNWKAPRINVWLNGGPR